MQNEKTKTVTLGAGVLTWDAVERRSDRYGSVYLIAEGGNSLAGDTWPSLIIPAATDLHGFKGRLVANVTATRESTHIGDLFRQVFPRTPKVGAAIVLGTGTLFTIGVNDGGIAVGLKPDDNRASDWLDIRALYDAHEQSVELVFEPETP